MLADGLGKDKQRQDAVAKLAKLASETKVADIKCAANYIVMNVSHMTNRPALHELKKQLSKLLARIPQSADLMAFDAAYNELMWVLPEAPEVGAAPSELLGHSGILFSSTSLPTLEREHDADDSDLPLLGHEKAKSKKPSGIYRKKW